LGGRAERLSSRRELLARGGAALAAAGLSRWLADAPGAAAATPVRSPAIIGTYGGLVVPATGAYFGADDTTRGFTTAKGIETQVGRRMAIRNRRYGWLAACPNASTRADAALSGPPVIPMVSFGQPSTFPVKTTGWKGKSDAAVTAFGSGIDRITNGEFDGYWSGVAAGLRALGMPVLFRLWQEPNGAHNPYYAAWQGGVGSGGEAAYIAAWRHVKAVFRAAGATIDAGGNCIFVFCAQRRSTASRWEVYWPGDDVVDFSGVDLYRDTFVDAAENPPKNWDTYTWAIAHSKPYIVCESGFVDKQKITTAAGKFDKDGSVTGHSLITDTQTTVAQSPQCVAYCVWNNIGPNGNNFIDTSAASLSQYRAFATDPYYALTR
jgi:hypothetical protein